MAIAVEGQVTRAQVLTELARLGAFFADTRPAPVMLEEYVAMAMDRGWDAGSLHIAVTHCIREFEFYPKPHVLCSVYLAIGGTESDELDAIRREWLALPYGGGSVWVRWAVQIVLWAWYSALLDTAFAVVKVEQAHVADLPRERIEDLRRQLGKGLC